MAELGLTQAALAAACGVELRTLQRWFAGQRVLLEHAERIACELGLGTAEAFVGVPGGDTASEIGSRMGTVARLLGARDSAFAQGLRLTREHFQTVRTSISFAAHPTHGFVARRLPPAGAQHTFVQIELTSRAHDLELEVRNQLGKQFGITSGRIRMRGSELALLEPFSTRSMLGRRRDDGGFVLWLWCGPEAKEHILVATRAFTASSCEPTGKQLCDVGSPAMAHGLCIRPHLMHLQAANLPMGFDRLVGSERANRVDVPVDW